MAKRKPPARPNYEEFRENSELDPEDGIGLCDEILELIEDIEEDFKDYALLEKAKDFSSGVKETIERTNRYTQKQKDGLQIWKDAIDKKLERGW